MTRAAVFFDLDKTICAVPTEQFLTKHFLQNGIIGKVDVLKILWGFLKYNLHLIPDYTIFRKQLILSIMQGMKVFDCEQAIQYTFENVLRSKIYPGIIEEIKKHQQQNRKIVIISTAINKIVEVFAKELKADYHYSTDIEVVENTFSGNIIGVVYHGHTKREAVLAYCKQHNINPADCFAYGDYYEDRHMMEAVGNPVAINPDKKLYKVAKERNWRTLNLSFPDVQQKQKLNRDIEILAR